jgi:hypothetical protein
VHRSAASLRATLTPGLIVGIVRRSRHHFKTHGSHDARQGLHDLRDRDDATAAGADPDARQPANGWPGAIAVRRDIRRVAIAADVNDRRHLPKRAFVPRFCGTACAGVLRPHLLSIFAFFVFRFSFAEFRLKVHEMRRTDLTEATMQGWARLDAVQRQRFFGAFLKAALWLDARRAADFSAAAEASSQSKRAPIDPARFTISVADIALLLRAGKSAGRICCRAGQGRGRWRLEPQTYARASIFCVGCDPISRPSLRTLALICELLPRHRARDGCGGRGTCSWPLRRGRPP